MTPSNAAPSGQKRVLMRSGRCRSVHPSDGCDVGTIVGRGDGADDGDVVGPLDGADDGAPVGAGLGGEIGAGEGQGDGRGKPNLHQTDTDQTAHLHKTLSKQQPSHPHGKAPC